MTTTTITVEVENIEVKCRRCGRVGHRKPTTIQDSRWTGHPGPPRLVVVSYEGPGGWDRCTVVLDGNRRDVELCPSCYFDFTGVVAAFLGKGAPF